MNIGIVTTWFERGAAYLARQHRDILAGEHRVFIYARGGESYAVGNRDWDDGTVRWGKPGIVPMRSSLDVDDFRHWVGERRLDAVIFLEQWWWEPVLAASELGLLIGAIIIEYTAPTVPFYGCYDFLICNTRQHADLFAWHPQVLYLPWGTDLETFRPSPETPVQPGVVTFFHSGGMNPYRKGTDLVVRAFARLAGRARLVVHTQIPLENSVASVVPLVRELEAAGSLTLRPETVLHPSKLYQMGDVCVYPSRFDGLGLTVAEALASGLPVIVSDSAPINEWIDDTTGRRVRIEKRAPRSDGVYWPQFFCDEDDLVSHLQWYVDRIDSLGKFSRQARAYAERHLRWTSNARELPSRLRSLHMLTDKRAAIDAARAFELQNARQSARFWLSYHYPRWVKAARSAWRLARSRPERNRETFR